MSLTSKIQSPSVTTSPSSSCYQTPLASLPSSPRSAGSSVGDSGLRSPALRPPADRTAAMAPRVPVPVSMGGPPPATLPPLTEDQRADLRGIAAAWAVAGQLAAAGHGHGHGAVVVDLDEAVHGAYAAINYAKQALQEGPGAVWKEFKADSAEWLGHPLDGAKATTVPHGNLDFGLGVGVSAVLLPLAVMAIKAGLEELKEARAQGRVLAGRQDQVNDLVARLTTVLDTAAGDPQAAQALQACLLQCRQESEDLGFARKQNRRAGETGLGSLLSGGAIAASVVAKMGLQVPLAVAAGGAGQIGTLAGTSAVAGTAATVAGIAGSLVLAPAAGLGAVYLGDRFVRKSAEKRKHLLQDTVPTRQYLADVKAALADPALQATFDRYHHFFETKSLQREKFYKQFHTLNKVFLAGSAVYASGALGKAAIAGAALAGAGTLAHPAGLAAVVALGALGGLVMGGGSVQFLTGHQKQGRYDGYFLGNHARLDRDFLAAADILHPGPQAEQAGVALRASVYETLQDNERSRQDFLQDIADQLGKYQGRIAYSTDPAGAGSARKTEHRPSRAERIAARVGAAGTFMQKLVRDGSVTKAMDAARASHASHTDRLTLHTLAEWVEDPAHFAAQAGFMQQQLARMVHSLEHKMALRQQVFPSGPGVSLAAHAAAAALPQDAESVAPLQQFLDKQDQAMLHDQSLRAQALLLADELGQIARSGAGGASTSADPKAAMALARARFMCLHAGECHDPAKAEVDVRASSRGFAKFLRRDAPRQYKELRGLLLETEMQATRMRSLAAQLAPPHESAREAGLQPTDPTGRGAGELPSVESVVADRWNQAVGDLRRQLAASGVGKPPLLPTDVTLPAAGRP